ncbi:Leucine-rich repeat [Dillenia turbinata]|uniref:Leucine-rich repeat n=1 Tax=Dillenia turbinata TaxID=194707 RepID=A0AAN8VAN5_9MAGN
MQTTNGETGKDFSTEDSKEQAHTKTLTLDNHKKNNKLADDVVITTNPVNDDDGVFDISGKNLDFPVTENSSDESESSIQGLYMYKNAFNLLPKSLGNLRKLKTLKFFSNEINLFSPELFNLVELECLQVKISSPGLNGSPLHKLKDLKELELSKVPARPSAFPLLSEISGLKRLTKLSVCHFSIRRRTMILGLVPFSEGNGKCKMVEYNASRYVPPEIGCLNNLEYLDLSFNKIKNLPDGICCLKALISLKVANNKLVELPSGLSSLQRLEYLDLSSNRLTSLGSLELGSMHNLQHLNLQYNKLHSCCQIPSWIRCNLEGNGKDMSNDDSVEMDVLEAAGGDTIGHISNNGALSTSSSILSGSSLSGRRFAARKLGKGEKPRYYLQQRARQERLNSSRKWKVEDRLEIPGAKVADKYKLHEQEVPFSESPAESASEIVGLGDKRIHSGEAECENSINNLENGEINEQKGIYVEKFSCVVDDSAAIIKEGENEFNEESSVTSLSDGVSEKDEVSSVAISKCTFSTKRHSDRDLDNPKPSKFRKPIDHCTSLSSKYSTLSFCSTEDHLPDGFYDAGRDRPFVSLQSYEEILHLDSREVILLDRERDEELDATTLSAQALVFQFKWSNGSVEAKKRVSVDNLQIASLLALFVSNHFGGGDRSAIIERARKSVSGSNYCKPFVCTCPTGNSNKIKASSSQKSGSEDVALMNLCEKSLKTIKASQKSIVVPIGSVKFGVCRHRALLMKYLCDRMEPPIPCELIRGYLDFSAHAWNVISVKRGDSWVRMIVDACRPHDIREETDPEYFFRYIPLSRVDAPITTQCILSTSLFPSLSTCDEIEKTSSCSLIPCKFGSYEAAAKVRTLETCGTSAEDVRNFEYHCLGEVRILSALKYHSCIVEIYGHQISSKWASSRDGDAEKRILQSAIFMEHIGGGSLKNYIEKLSKAGEKHVPLECATSIARDVACALVELHSKHIIHRDIKSENVLIDLDRKRADGTPVVKLCDFDRAVPLRSSSHTCCIGHDGIPAADACVGTPRWMAPEVLQAMHIPNSYGLEIDIWSFGCLLLELLTLQVPYSGLPESDIHNLLQMGKRPPLTEELEALLIQEPTVAQSRSELDRGDAETETMTFLVDLFRQCTVENPTERPTAERLYELLLAHTSSSTSTRS